jgi:3-deoxy-D-manno-octulosonate 8-phosphate phosphatase (KDO 8-P phosphatase)
MASALRPETERVLARARLLALDVDGTLTAGRVSYLDERELVEFDVRDGQGLVWLREAGVEIAWISGRGCAATKVRAAELGVRELHLRAGPKAAVLAEIQERRAIAREETVAMGDDLVDLGLRSRAAFFAAPADAAAAVRERADLVTRSLGGRGAVRELCEALLAAKGLWDARVDRHVHGVE